MPMKFGTQFLYFFLLYPYFFDCLRQKYMFIFEYLYFCEKLKDYAH